jgi:hypothetical protein
MGMMLRMLQHADHVRFGQEHLASDARALRIVVARRRCRP